MKTVTIRKDVFAAGLLLMGVTLILAIGAVATTHPLPVKPVVIDTDAAQKLFETCVKAAPPQWNSDYLGIVEQCTASSRKLAQKN